MPHLGLARSTTREQLAEADQVKRTVREYLEELEQENSTYEPLHQRDHISKTDPDATYSGKIGPAVMGYFANSWSMT